MSEPRQRASWWEILGAWLHVWTPPRDVEIPSPRWALVAGTVLVVAVTVVVVTLVAPAIDRSKDSRAAQAAQSKAAGRKAIEARLTAEQRAKHGSVPAAARLYEAGQREAALAALIAAARTSVDRDISARVAAGALPGPIRRVRCAPRERERGARVHLDCLAVTAAHVHKRIHELQLGHPFIVGASLHDGRYAWCKRGANPAEGSLGKNVQVPLPVACTS